MRDGLLVTAFEPFGGADLNPTEVALRGIVASRRFGESIVAMFLPVTYAGGPMLLAERMRVLRPAGVLMFGFDARATTLEIESTARNVCDQDAADNAGVVRHGVPVVRGGPEQLEAGPLASRVESALRRRDVPVSRSDDAGRFVCNATMYLALYHERRRPVLFVHVPPTTPLGGAVSPETLQSWMESAVEETLAAMRSAPRDQ